MKKQEKYTSPLKFLVAGQLTLFLAVFCTLLNVYIFEHLILLDFLSGAFTGISMVMNLAFLLRYHPVKSKDG